jgi:hypothetical protein
MSTDVATERAVMVADANMIAVAAVGAWADGRMPALQAQSAYEENPVGSVSPSAWRALRCASRPNPPPHPIPERETCLIPLSCCP